MDVRDEPPRTSRVVMPHGRNEIGMHEYAPGGQHIGDPTIDRGQNVATAEVMQRLQRIDHIERAVERRGPCLDQISTNPRNRRLPPPPVITEHGAAIDRRDPRALAPFVKLNGELAITGAQFEQLRVLDTVDRIDDEIEQAIPHC